MLNYPLYRVIIILAKHSVIWWYRCIYVTWKYAPYKHIFFSLFFKDSLLHTKNLRVFVVMFLKEFLKVDVFAYVVIYMPIMSNVMIAFNVFVNHVKKRLSLVDGCGYRT